MRIAVEPERTVPARDHQSDPRYTPWLEVSALIEARIPEWRYCEREWFHWAAPATTARMIDLEWNPFAPGRRGAIPGRPRGADLSVGFSPEALRELVGSFLAGVCVDVFRNTAVGLASHLGESAGAFRRRCLALLGPAIRSGTLEGAEGAASLSRISGAAESRTVVSDDLAWLTASVRIAWYPDGDPPRAASGDLFESGSPTEERE